MTFAAALFLLISKAILVEGFCFMGTARVGAWEVRLGSGLDVLKAPFALEHNVEFNSDFYDCSVVNQAKSDHDLTVHCCYNQTDLEDEAMWSEEKFRDALKRIYFV